MTVPNPNEVPPEEAAVYRQVLALGTLWARGDHRAAAAETLQMDETTLRHAVLAAVDMAVSMSCAVPFYQSTTPPTTEEKMTSWARIAHAWFRERDHND